MMVIKVGEALILLELVARRLWQRLLLVMPLLFSMPIFYGVLSRGKISKENALLFIV